MQGPLKYLLKPSVNINVHTAFMFTVAFGVFLSFVIFPVTVLATNASVSSTCASGIKSAYVAPGQVLVESVFSVIQALLSRVGAALYLGITNTQTFQNIVAATISLYIAVYGLMVTMNIVSHSLTEVATRLMRITFVYILLAWGTNGYIYFDKYVITFFLHGMNELIGYMTTAAGGVVIPFTAPPPLPAATPSVIAFLAAMPTQTVDPAAASVLFGAMNKVLNPFYLIAILTLFTMTGAGPIIALGMGWGFVQFVKMVFGALITYVRSVVALTFLFGIAPVFIIFLLFERTRTIFQGWLNQVVGFAIAPVLMFAFLTFFSQLIDDVLISMFHKVDFCMQTHTPVSGSPMDITWWVPTYEGKPYVGNWQLPPAINVVNIMFFLMLCHLGKSFNDYVGRIAQNISQGMGPASAAQQQVGDLLKSGGLSKTENTRDGLSGMFGHKNQAKNSVPPPSSVPRANIKGT